MIIAWLPTTAASTAITKTGHLNFSERSVSDKFSMQKLFTHNIFSNKEQEPWMYRELKCRSQYDSYSQNHDAWSDKLLAPYMQGQVMDIPWMWRQSEKTAFLLVKCLREKQRREFPIIIKLVSHSFKYKRTSDYRDCNAHYKPFLN